jgi:hypothetical protein
MIENFNKRSASDINLIIENFNKRGWPEITLMLLTVPMLFNILYANEFLVPAFIPSEYFRATQNKIYLLVTIILLRVLIGCSFDFKMISKPGFLEFIKYVKIPYIFLSLLFSSLFTYCFLPSIPYLWVDTPYVIEVTDWNYVQTPRKHPFSWSFDRSGGKAFECIEVGKSFLRPQIVCSHSLARRISRPGEKLLLKGVGDANLGLYVQEVSTR